VIQNDDDGKAYIQYAENNDYNPAQYVVTADFYVDPGTSTTFCTKYHVKEFEERLKHEVNSEVEAVFNIEKKDVTITCDPESIKIMASIDVHTAATFDAVTEALKEVFATTDDSTRIFSYIQPGLKILTTAVINGVVLGSCSHWCDEHTCDKKQCSGCPVCLGEKAGAHCASYCSVYTCYLNGGYCINCDVCKSLEEKTHCEPWCNFYTCWLRGGFCSGCLSCGGTPKTESPWATPVTTKGADKKKETGVGDRLSAVDHFTESERAKV